VKNNFGGGIMAADKDELLKHNQHLRSLFGNVEATSHTLNMEEVVTELGWYDDDESASRLYPLDELHRFLLREMTDSTVTVLPNGIILSSNEQCASALGVPSISLVGACMYDFVMAEDTPAFGALLAGAPTLEAHIRLTRPGATRAHVLARVRAHTLLTHESKSICLLIATLGNNTTSAPDFKAAKRDNADLLNAMQLQTQQLRSAPTEKQLLLQEVHHRVNNNLQVICSLLSMQANRASETAARELEETQSRVMCMALIHESLCRSQHHVHVDLNEFARSFVVDSLRRHEWTAISWNLLV
jgi:hypothetical protein